MRMVATSALVAVPAGAKVVDVRPVMRPSACVRCKLIHEMSICNEHIGKLGLCELLSRNA